MTLIINDEAPARPWVGRVAAGFPSPATEALDDTITLTQYLVDHPATSFLHTVADDALAGRGIYRWDRVIVEQKDARAGDTVLARADGDCVLRVLKRDRDGYYLAAAHPDYPILDKLQDTRILGVVVALARRIGART